jgi:enterobactin synthetase component D
LPAFATTFSIVHEADAADEPEPLFPTVLLPARLRSAARRRRAEFLAGRFCAQEALRAAGFADGAATLDALPGGGPFWPPGVVGAITHTRTFASAAVARADDALSLGIDAELLVPHDQAAEVRSSIALPGELEAAAAVATSLEEALTLVFSAKESVYKCLHPLVGRYFDYLDAAVALAADGSFEATLHVDLAPAFPEGTRLRGKFAVEPPHVHTGIALVRAPARGGAGRP